MHSNSVNVLAMAKYLKSKINEDKTNKEVRIQILLYYAQGFHMALNQGVPLFYNKIEAWRLCPVVTDVYFNWANVDNAVDISNSTYTDLLDEVLQTFAKWKTSELVTQTHIEDPWLEAIKNQRSEITLDSMYRFFITKLITKTR